MIKNVLTLMLSLAGLLFVLPADAAVAVRKQALNKASQAPDMTPGATDDRGFICITLGGVYSARIYADAQNNTHLAYKETSSSEEVELTPESVGFVYDAVPNLVRCYMVQNPSWSYEEALEEATESYYSYYYYEENKTDLIKLYKDVLGYGLKDAKNMVDNEYASGVNTLIQNVKSSIPNSNVFWSNAAIYLGDLNTPTANVNTTLTMTGGKVYSIVAAGEIDYDGGAMMEKTEEDTDTGNATINIQGGTVNYVAPSVGDTKYFSGTVKIYMQNCTYAGRYFPNLIDSHCTATVVATGVTYLNESARLNYDSESPSYCRAANSVLQDVNGDVTCNGSELITLPSSLSAINCPCFYVTNGTMVSLSVDVNASTALYIRTQSTALTYNLYITSGTTVTTGKIQLMPYAVVRNRGTVNVTKCRGGGYVASGSSEWQESYTTRFGGVLAGKEITYQCNQPHFAEHSYTNIQRSSDDPVLGVRLYDYACKWCQTPETSDGPAYYLGEYDVTDKVFTGTLTEDVVCKNGIRYSRTYADGYQALYLPFSLSYSNWSSIGDIYRINNIHEYDTNNDDEIDSWTLEIVKLKDGQTTKPNTPYVIKPHSAGYSVLTSDARAQIHATNVAKSIDCSSTLYKFEFTGTPAAKTITANSDFYLTEGGLFYGTNDVTLGTYRWYMSIIDRETGEKINPSQFNAAKRISVFCEEDGEMVTGTLNMEEDTNFIPADAVIYDLNGQKVSKMIDGKIYIVNGKKFKK